MDAEPVATVPLPSDPLQQSTNDSTLLRDSLCLVLLRTVYFFLARRFLEHSLNPALRDWSKPVLPTYAQANTSERREADSEDDSSRASSIPGSPSIAHQLLPDSGSTGASTPTERSASIELSELSRRLTEGVNASVPVLNLSHSTGGSSKKSTRQLSRASRFLFCLCFAEGCNLMSVVICNISDIFSDSSRRFNFSLSLHILLVQILLILPMVQCILLTYRARDSSQSTSTRSISFPIRILVSLLPFGLYCFLFSLIPPYITAVDSDSTGWHWLAPLMGRLVVLGIVSLAGLSGFGAVRTAWNFYEHARGVSGAQVTHDDVLRAEGSLYRIKHEIADKRNRLVGKTKGSWFARDALAGVRAELAGLEAMHSETVKEVANLKKKRARQEFSTTLQGRLYNFIGQIFAVYCGARVVMCLPSVFFAPGSTERSRGNTNGDWFSFLLALGLSQLGIENFNVALWSRAISLLLTGIIVLASLAQILRSVGRVIRLASKAAAAGFLLLSLGQLFSTYMISLLVQIRASLQEDSDSLLVSLPDFRVFGRLFDLVFLFAAAGTLIYKYVAMKVAGDA